MESISSNSRKIKNHQKEFHDASRRLCKRSAELLNQSKTYKNGFEIAADLYYRGRTRSHFGTSSYENFIANIFCLQPLLDSEMMRIKFNKIGSLPHDLTAYIYVRFAYDLINFPFEGKRILNPESIKRAEKLNKKFGYYKKKYNYKQNFFIDNKRKSPASFSKYSKYNGNAREFIKELVKTNKINYHIHKIYDDSIYKWSVENINKTEFYPLRHINSLLAIAKTLEDISANKQKLGLIQNNNEAKIKNHLFDL